MCSQIKSLIQPNPGKKNYVYKPMLNVKWVGPPPSLIIIHPEEKNPAKTALPVQTKLK